MSEHRITKVEKEKDPRRVEAGKRLASISRAAKEKKTMERQREEAQTVTHNEDDDSDSSGGGVGTITLLTGVGVLSGLVCLYFTYRQDKRAEQPQQAEDEGDSQKQSTPRKPSGSETGGVLNKLRSLDD